MANEQENKESTNPEQTTASTEATSLGNFGDQSSNASGNADAERIAALERELQQERVEQGRLRQANDEVRKLRDEINKLKAENASFKQRKASDYLTDKDLAQVDEEQLSVIDKVVKGRVGDMSEMQRAENERLRAEIARRDQSMAENAAAQFNAEVERLAPGLSSAIAEHKTDWDKWASSPRRKASVIAAFNARDAVTVSEFFQEFAQAKGIQTNRNGNAARPGSSFSPRGGNHPLSMGGDTSTYTLEQYNAEMRKASDDVNAGRITPDQYRAIKQKFDTALNEGRVTQ